MFRLTNPTNELLNNSLCFFKVRDASINSNVVNSEIYKSLVENGGKIRGTEGNEIELTVPHNKADAFAGIFALNNLVQTGDDKLIGISPVREEACFEFQGRKFRYHNWQIDQETIVRMKDSQKTFLQDFILRISDLEIVRRFEKIALPVCLDNLSDINANFVWGNSLVILPFQLDEVVALAKTDRNSWRNFLISKARRVSEILKRKSNVGPLRNTLLISSLGSLDSYSWANQIDLRKLTMVPTPMSSDSINIVIWASEGTQTLAICAEATHWVWSRAEDFSENWTGLVNGSK